MATLSTPPASGQIVQHDGKEYETVKEGLAYILYPRSEDKVRDPKKPKSEEKPQSVFYNPIQQFNRDLSVLAIRAYGEHLLAVKKQKAEKRRQIAVAKGKKRKRGNEDGVEMDAAAPSGGNVEGNNVTTDSTTTTAPADPLAAESSAVAAEQQKTPPSFTILDALSATGLRALRYAKEIPFATRIVANDLSPSAIESMKMNIEYNGLDKVVQPNNGDACAYMYSLLGPQKPSSNGTYFGKFDVIDLDPYGTAAPFMDAAVQAVSDGGLLCVTCTDAGVFASTGYPEKAYALYGGVSVKGSHSHEAGLRLIIHGLATSAAKYGLAIEPLLSLSIDFYARVFVRVHKSPAEVKFISGNTMLVYNCDNGCGAWTTQPLTHTRQKLGKNGEPFYHYGLAQGPVAGPNCEHCGFKTHIGGPMWGGPLHNPHFIQKILDMLPGADRDIYQTVDRIEGMLTTALEEDLDLGAPSKEATPEPGAATTGEVAPAQPSAIIPRVDPALRDHHPFFFTLSALAKVLHTQTMPIDAFRGALRHLGYRSTRSHTKPNTIRTDAPWDVIWEIMREWVRQKSPIKEDALKPGSAGAAIMKKSRENLKKLGEENEWLSSLKKEIMAAVESGKDVSDLTTKIEAALYRSGSRQALGKDTTTTAVAAAAEPQQPQDQAEQQQQKEKENGAPRAEGAQVSAAERPHPSTLDIVFDEALGREAAAAHTKKRLVRYQMNPRANWGPLSRASGPSR
ncbi:hypothetical protein VTN00DRAFT_2886 [Thermoascus crustaceus]|uniref:uncharacterized protein n=1 Tax=Thermoascus crustaceus TaxID=5088 RepID=UPI003743AA6A